MEFSTIMDSTIMEFDCNCSRSKHSNFSLCLLFVTSVAPYLANYLDDLSFLYSSSCSYLRIKGCNLFFVLFQALVRSRRWFQARIRSWSDRVKKAENNRRVWGGNNQPCWWQEASPKAPTIKAKITNTLDRKIHNHHL